MEKWYGTSDNMFKDFKEQIIRAVSKSQIEEGEDPNGRPIYKTVTKDEALKRVIEIYDETVYQFNMVNTGSRALEKLFLKYNPDIDSTTFLNDYMEAVEKERQKDRETHTYNYNSDKEAENEQRRAMFSVIKGGKKD